MSPNIGGDVQDVPNSRYVVGLQGRPVSNTPPTKNQALAWNGSQWVPTTVSGGSGVPSVDGITSAVTLNAGSNITITDNSPSAGHITIAASGGAISNAFATGNNAGNITTSSTSFVDLGLSTSISAAIGDILDVSFTCQYETSAASGVNNFFAVLATTSSTSIVQHTTFSPGNSNWIVYSVRRLYTVVSGDISGGSVAVKVQFAMGSGGTLLTVQNSGGAKGSPHLAVVNLKH